MSAVGEQDQEADVDEGHHGDTSTRSSEGHPANIICYFPNRVEEVMSEVHI